jgi:hypothetical protein
LIVAILVTLGMVIWIALGMGDHALRPIESLGRRFAHHRLLTLLSMALATILIRLALLPVLPVPAPGVHDEFSNLLLADTLAHGRLTNPPHPVWIFFDTFHVLQHPTYASKYPPAPGAAMALGQLMGHPWIGVLLCMVAMVVAMTWMCQGWFPPPWALLGGILALLHYALFVHWVDSYYNGSVALTGAALVLGAYPRILHRGRVRDGFLLGLGAMILAYSRPVEGLIFCAPVGIALLWAQFSKPNLHGGLARIRVALPFAAVVFAGLLFMAYYNARVTGSFLQFPYMLYQKQYINFPAFMWQKPTPPLRYDNPQFELFFNVWQRSAFSHGWRAWPGHTWWVTWSLWFAVLGQLLTVPFLTARYVVRDHRMRVPLIVALACYFGLISVVWFQPHYAAPLIAAVFLLLIQAIRHLRRIVLNRWPVGIFLTRLLVVLTITWVLVQAHHGWRDPVYRWPQRRLEAIKALEAIPGRHLVLVRYSPLHNVHGEWVYNSADIDHSRIVWAREIPGRDLRPLLEYFRDRQVWVVQPDVEPITFEPYRQAPQGALQPKDSLAGYLPTPGGINVSTGNQ